MASRPTYIELCAGIGGISIALERCGLAPVCRVERDAYAASVLVARMEDSSLGRAPIWDDLTTFDGRPWRGGVDLVAAGFPCQPFSLAGKRLGEADERAIWPEIERIVRECEPAAVFLENVRPEAFLGPFLGLRGLGFRFAPLYETSAHEVGAPHLRVRYFALAYRDGDGLRRITDSRLQRTDVSDVDGCYSVVVDANGARLEVGRPEPVSRPRATAWPPGPADECGWREWIASGGPEPVLRRGASRVPARMDGGLSHADAAQGSSGQSVREVRSANGAQDVRESLGRLGGLRPSSILRDGVLKPGESESGSEPRCVSEARVPDARIEVRTLRDDQSPIDPSRGPELAQQRSEQPSDSLREMPHDDSSRARRYSKGPEDFRLDRLRCLGNAVVPDCAERAFRWLMENAT